MSTWTILGGLAAGLGLVSVAGYAWDRVRGRRTEPARRDPATARYYRDGGDPTFGLDQNSNPFG